MRKGLVPAQSAGNKKAGGRKVRCTKCLSEYALPVRNGKVLVYECPKCHTQYTFQTMDG